MSTSIRFSNFVRKAFNVSSGGQDGDLCHSICQHFFSFLSTTFSQNLYETLCNCFLEHFKFKLKFNMLLISILKINEEVRTIITLYNFNVQKMSCFRNEICQGFMGRGVNRKPLASKDKKMCRQGRKFQLVCWKSITTCFNYHKFCIYV